MGEPFLYFDRHGRPITLQDFARLHADMAYRRVGSHDVGPWWVSTVWLGINHRFGPGPPLIFETMAFRDDTDGEDSPADEWTARYSTEEQARAGHAYVVRMLAAIWDVEPVERPD